MDIKKKLSKQFGVWVTKLKDDPIFSTLKFKFLFWNIILSTVSIAVILLVFFETTQYILYSQFNSNLLYTANEVSSIVGHSSSSFSANKVSQFHNKKFIGYFIVVLNSNGHVVAESNNIKLNSSFITSVFNAIQDKTNSSVFTQKIGNQDLSLISIPTFNSFGDLSGVVIVGNSINIIHDTLHTLLIVMFFMALIFIFIVVLFTFYFSDKITDPLADITSQIVSITGFNLNQRIKTKNYDKEFNTMSEEFNKLLNRLENTFDREKSFINDVAHEIKTPLAIINGETELYLKSKKDDIVSYKKMLDANLYQARKIEKVLNDVLSLARVEYNTSSYITEKIDIQSLLSEIAMDMKIIAQTKGIECNYIINGKDFYVFSNKENLSKAILNILTNSIKYTKKGSVILSLSKKAKNIFISIEDTGIGIKEEDLPKIFNRFYRSPNVRNIEGTGLGLSISKSIIEGYKGTILVESKISLGTKFTIILPEFR